MAIRDVSPDSIFPLLGCSSRSHALRLPTIRSPARDVFCGALHRVDLPTRNSRCSTASFSVVSQQVGVHLQLQKLHTCFLWVELVDVFRCFRIKMEKQRTKELRALALVREPLPKPTRHVVVPVERVRGRMKTATVRACLSFVSPTAWRYRVPGSGSRRRNSSFVPPFPRTPCVPTHLATRLAARSHRYD